MLKAKSRISEESQNESQRVRKQFREEKQKQQQVYDDLINDLKEKNEQSIAKNKEEQEIIRFEFDKEGLI